MELLIDKEYVAGKLQVSKGYKKEDFENVFIREAQQLDLKPLLCEAFYYELVINRQTKKYEKLIEGSNYYYEGRNYKFEGLGTVVSYFAYARFLIKSNVVSTSHGFHSKEAEFSDDVPLADRKDLYCFYRRSAHTFFDEVKKYVERHKQIYPLWCCNKCDKSKSDESKVEFSTSRLIFND